MDQLALIEKLLRSTTSGTDPERVNAAGRARDLIKRVQPVFFVGQGTHVQITAPPSKAGPARPLRYDLRLYEYQLREDSPLESGILAFNIRSGDGPYTHILFVAANLVQIRPPMR